MIQIHTKQRKSFWYCYATFDCMDYSFKSKVKEKAQNKMKDQLAKSDLVGHALWMNENIILEPLAFTSKLNGAMYKKSRLDEGMV